MSKTTDGGVTWTPLPPMFGHALYSVSGVGDKVWIVGINGFIAYSPDFGGTWQTLTKHHTESVRSISFVSAQTGYLMTFNGAIRKTTNGGQDWKTVSQLIAGPVIDAVDAAQFVSENVGYAGQEYGQIAKTTDGGVTWTTMMVADSNFQSATRALTILNENTGFFARSNKAYDSDQFARTTNGGLSFTTRDTATKKQPRSIAFLDANRGFIGAGSGILRATSDGGATWFVPTLSGTPTGVSKTGDINGFCIVDSANMWLVGSKMFYKSTDLGKTWSYVAHGGVTADSLFYSIAFSGNTGYAIGYTGLMVKTTDGGASWKQVTDIPSTQLLYYVTFDKSGHAWVSSATGYVFTNAPLTSVKNSGGTLPEGFALDQNYPNPFNPATLISFHIPIRSDVNLTVYDILGREVSILVNDNLVPGNYTVPFNGSKYASGVYWYALRSGAFASTKKMILIK
jgi:photosystem II stability/assembly factor-like uncharacterized protein